jgi:hypothetical protein
MRRKVRTMEELLLLVPLLACPIMMVAMMWLMGRGMSGGRKEQKSEAEPTLADLRGERDRLATEVERGEAEEERSAGTGTPSHA